MIVYMYARFFFHKFTFVKLFHSSFLFSNGSKQHPHALSVGNPCTITPLGPGRHRREGIFIIIIYTIGILLDLALVRVRVEVQVRLEGGRGRRTIEMILWALWRGRQGEGRGEEDVRQVPTFLGLVPRLHEREQGEGVQVGEVEVVVAVVAVEMGPTPMSRAALAIVMPHLVLGGVHMDGMVHPGGE